MYLISIRVFYTRFRRTLTFDIPFMCNWLQQAVCAIRNISLFCCIVFPCSTFDVMFFSRTLTFYSHLLLAEIQIIR